MVKLQNKIRLTQKSIQMKVSVYLYPVVFIVAILLFFRLEKIEPYKNFYVQFPDQQKCFQDLLQSYTQDDSLKVFSIIPVIINQCSYNLLRVYFKPVRVGYNPVKTVLFLPREKEINDVVVSHNEFIFSDDEECLIVHASESPDIRMELKMKKKYPSCKVVKVSTRAIPDMENKVEVVRKRLRVTFKKHSRKLEQESVDLDTLIRVYLKNRYIEALYLDESVSSDDLLEFSNQKDFAKLFPVCQLTVTLRRPKSKSAETKFWQFVRYFLFDSQLVFVSSQRIDKDTIDVVMYNPVHQYCSFKHFSIPFNHKGIKF